MAANFFLFGSEACSVRGLYIYYYRSGQRPMGSHRYLSKSIILDLSKGFVVKLPTKYFSFVYVLIVDLKFFFLQKLVHTDLLLTYLVQWDHSSEMEGNNQKWMIILVFEFKNSINKHLSLLRKQGKKMPTHQRHGYLMEN